MINKKSLLRQQIFWASAVIVLSVALVNIRSDNTDQTANTASLSPYNKTAN